MKIGFFKTALACSINALSAVLSTVEQIQQANKILAQKAEEPAPSPSEAPVKELTAEEWVEGVIQEAAEAPSFNSESLLVANEALLACKAFILLSVDSKGDMQYHIDTTLATDVEVGGLHTLLQKVQIDLQDMLFGEPSSDPRDSEEEF